MTHIPVRWTRVLFGAGLTLAVAIAPMIYLLIVAPVPDGRTRNAEEDQSALGLVSNGFNLGDHRTMFLLIAGIAIALVMTAVAVAARSQHTEAQRTRS